MARYRVEIVDHYIMKVIKDDQEEYSSNPKVIKKLRAITRIYIQIE